MKLPDCLLLVALLAACAGGPYHSPPRYAPPETRTAAARQLYEAMATGGNAYSDIDADKEHLRFSMKVRTATGTKFVPRELVYAAIYAVEPARKDGAGWIVRVDAAGGLLTLRFTDDISAAKAESALQRLSPLREAPVADPAS